MSNSYFRFKQFTIHQEKAAMKVCTDACLFGAWVAVKFENEVGQVKRILDVGAGTGLLSLMLAQKISAAIDAVEIDTAAAEQAKENFSASDFRDRLTLFRADIKDFAATFKYNLIVSNPPFFSNDLKSNSAKRNLALHSDGLSLQELTQSVKTLLTEDGLFAILLPFHRTSEFINTTKENGFYINEQVLVKQTENHHYFRSMLLFSRERTETITTEIVIKEQGNYSDQFIALLKPYYLFL